MVSHIGTPEANKNKPKPLRITFTIDGIKGVSRALAGFPRFQRLRTRKARFSLTLLVGKGTIVNAWQIFFLLIIC
jgi:hypothetical protein